MSLTTMYPGKILSPQLTLTTEIDDDDTIIVVTGDTSKLPAAPNIFVLGTEEDSETVYYPTDAVENTFTDVTRAFEGTAKSWVAGTVIARLFTDYDYETLRTNILDLESRKSLSTLTLYAHAAIQPFTNNAALGQGTGEADLSNGFSLPYATFTVANRGTDRLQWLTTLVNPWSSGNMFISVEWTANTTDTDDVTWLVYASCIGDGESLDVTPVLVSTITDTHTGGVYYKNLSAVSEDTLSGTGDTILWEVRRSSAETDTLTEDALFISLKVYYEV